MMIFRIFLYFLFVNFIFAKEKVRLTLPTQNQYIFSSTPYKFYMYTNREFEGRKSKPWQGGTFGFSRNQKRYKGRVYFTGFHEGIDIRPLSFDEDGEPKDVVRAIADGTVVYMNRVARRSNYGIYVVVEHDWGDGKFYSLYAHLVGVGTNVGAKLGMGGIIGKLGYTGRGIDKKRAHLHLELNVLLNERFSKWHNRHFKTANHHGLHNGINMAGLDLPSLYRKLFKNPNLRMSQFIAMMAPYYKVVVPIRNWKKESALIRRYPWLLKNGDPSKAESWEIVLSQSGFPLQLNALDVKVKKKSVFWVKSSSAPHSYKTKSYLSGFGNKAKLSRSGTRYVNLLLNNF